MSTSNQRWHEAYRGRALTLPHTYEEYERMIVAILRKHAQLLSIRSNCRKVDLLSNIKAWEEYLPKEKFPEWKSRVIRYNKQLDSAVVTGDLNKAKLLVAYGADVNCKPKGDCLLFKSITHGDLAMFEFLIQSGAHVDNFDSSVRKVIILMTITSYDYLNRLPHYIFSLINIWLQLIYPPKLYTKI